VGLFCCWFFFWVFFFWFWWVFFFFCFVFGWCVGFFFFFCFVWLSGCFLRFPIIGSSDCAPPLLVLLHVVGIFLLVFFSIIDSPVSLPSVAFSSRLLRSVALDPPPRTHDKTPPWTKCFVPLFHFSHFPPLLSFLFIPSSFFPYTLTPTTLLLPCLWLPYSLPCFRLFSSFASHRMFSLTLLAYLSPHPHPSP